MKINMDFFSEMIVKKKKTAVEIAAVTGIFAAGFVLINLCLRFAGYLQGFFPVVLLAVFYLMYQGLTSLNVEYEYMVTNEELDIDRITAKSRRKRLLSVSAKDFEYFAPLSSAHRQASESADIVRRLNLTSDMNLESNYFAVFTFEGQKCRLVFRPNEKMIENFSKYVKRGCFFTS